MIKRIISLLLLLLVPQLVLAATDARMQIEVVAKDSNTAEFLRANIDKAAELALPKLWQRIVLQEALNKIPDSTNAIRFLQRATPSQNGMMVTFDQRRVLSFLKQNRIPHIAEQPAWNLSVQLSSASGRAMPESAAMLEQFAAEEAETWGYGINAAKASLVLHWRWLDSRQVELSVRGTSKLGEFSETRAAGAGDPFRQLKPWLSSVLLRARDAYASNAPKAVPSGGIEAANGVAMPQNRSVFLVVERHASLPEQVLFEEELRRDPRVLELSLRQTNRDGQQYRMILKGEDELWLPQWFKRRGLSLTSSVEGWVAR
ncbi:hypothetical protein Ga0123462_0219 [Mariprofundus ferrinatatus]|uniref:DUF2066 domain-containing protein n=1 Tax=Mariprofundus ferrinatatus TaxID=1921087 RepID=A0A2K8L1D6_9PROT|nr:hypothetical protein [Mariprofundus ferrinatatus]ATX81097.1 hypothetical protein Ga0123462_0219 [Mariprofundus ferrinatatus]